MTAAPENNDDDQHSGTHEEQPTPAARPVRERLLGTAVPHPDAVQLDDSIGMTGYLDFLVPADAPHPLMAGVDAAGRPFVTMHVVDATALDDEGKDLKRSWYFPTFFQRYTDNPDLWVSAGSKDLLFTCGGLKPEQIDFVRRIAEAGGSLVRAHRSRAGENDGDGSVENAADASENEEGKSEEDYWDAIRFASTGNPVRGRAFRLASQSEVDELVENSFSRSSRVGADNISVASCGRHLDARVHTTHLGRTAAATN